MQRDAGHPAYRLDVLTEPLLPPGRELYAAVLANAVFLHSTPEQLHHVLTKVIAALEATGLLPACIAPRDTTPTPQLGERDERPEPACTHR